jgi:hypothetical protein
MPIFGVTRAILDEECGSTSGEDDFFSVASTMPFVAMKNVSRRERMSDLRQTFDA